MPRKTQYQFQDSSRLINQKRLILLQLVTNFHNDSVSTTGCQVIFSSKIIIIVNKFLRAFSSCFISNFPFAPRKKNVRGGKLIIVGEKLFNYKRTRKRD